MRKVMEVFVGENGEIGVKLRNIKAKEVPLAWGAVTASLIDFTEEHGSFDPDMETALHGMLDCVIKDYKENKKTEKPKGIPLESFEAFKEDFFKEMPEAREKFEGGNPLSQAISDAILKGTYEILKERSKK